MKDTFLSARLVAEDLIRLTIFSSLPYEKFDTILVTDRIVDEKISPFRNNSTAGIMILDYRLAAPLELGHSYALAIASYGLVALDVNEATSFPSFDKAFAYDGDDLGPTYRKESTSFALWAPLASSVLLKFKREENDEWELREMKRTEKGVFRYELAGDCQGLVYRYLTTNSELTSESIDPYAKASTANSEASVVLDFSALKRNSHKEALPVLNSYTDAVIYEGSVRDLTIDRHSTIEKKGTYAGLVEKNRKTNGGNPAGFDYFVSLGITHLQLLPIYDFATVDELNPLRSYNWGYDPRQYFVPEGSYATNANDPLARIQECRDMVIAFHQAGVRIVQDVVFNHVYEYLSSPFEKIVPNYYFRRKTNGRMANTSYCGDDVASERPMVRKLILDACKWWIDFYGIDGFRFDLMGIIDVETLKEIERYGKSQDSSFVVYGEGWNMGGEVASPLGTIENHALLPGFAFFNDRFRESAKKWLSLDYSAFEGFKFAYLSSSLDYGAFHALFLNANQSLNYVECHDNATFFDWISNSRPALGNDEKLDLAKLGIASVLLSFGVPFIHAGEEIGQSKFGKDNTYDLPDVYNRFSYALLDERLGMAAYLRSLIQFRKTRRFLHWYDPRVIAPMVELSDFQGALCVKIADPNELCAYREINFFFNPTDANLIYALPYDEEIMLDATGFVEDARLLTRSVMIPRHSVIATCLKKDCHS